MHYTHALLDRKRERVQEEEYDDEEEGEEVDTVVLLKSQYLDLCINCKDAMYDGKFSGFIVSKQHLNSISNWLCFYRQYYSC